MQNQNRGFKKYSENNIDNYLFLDYESNLMGYVKNNKLMRIMNITSDEIGNIYRARVKNIDRDLNAAFVDLGDNGIGFLQLDKDSSVNESDILILQVIKMPDNKGLKLTLEVAIPDKYFVIFPFDKFVKFSKKLDSEFRKRNEEKLLNISEKEGVGILLRTETKVLTEEEFILKLNSAISTAQKIKNEENKLPVPKLLYEKDGVGEFLLNFKEVKNLITNRNYENDKFNVIYDDSFSIKYKPEIINRYKTFFEKNVVLENGSRIIIEKTEAMTVIDVDTHKYTSNNHKNFEKTLFDVNKEASEEIFNQIINRNISGIIMIDLLKMRSKRNTNKILAWYKDIFSSDKNIKYMGFTNLGLLEISRKNSGQELINMW